MAIIGRDGKATMRQGKTSSAGRAGLYRELERMDKVALEAGNLALIMAREIID